MLLQCDPYPPFDAPCTTRLIALENVLRRHSEGQMALRTYRALLQDQGLEMPRSARTLQEDLRRYAAYCDDLRYGEHAKTLQLNPLATRDAVIWLLGRAWLDSPLRPRLASACLRCLLLAQRGQAEIAMQYRRLRRPHEPWHPEVITGIPLRIIPGTDSGYVQLHMADGRRANFNVARIEQFVSITGQPTTHYVPLSPQRYVMLTIETADAYLLDRLCWQFQGLSKQSPQCAVMQVDESLLVMTIDVLTAHFRRTQQGMERRLPSMPCTLQLEDHVLLHCQEVQP